MSAPASNRLFYGDNLPILRNLQYFPNGCVDLIYLDPPFNSNRDYNIIFKDDEGKQPDAQIKAFQDTWEWTPESDLLFDDIVQRAPSEVVTVLNALKAIYREGRTLAYLLMMTARLLELHRVLKPTGTLYLHCDQSASHQLKIILDAIFGPDNFRNDIIWQRVNAKGLATKKLPTNHDYIFCYTKSNVWTWNQAYLAHDPESNYVKKSYRHIEPETGRQYRLDNLVNPNKKRPNLEYEFLGVKRVWRWTRDRMQAAYEKGLVIQSKPGNVPSLKRYLDEQEGTSLGTVWTDIKPVQGSAKEYLGYPTQKPLSLLERIISMSSNPGDIVLDPFCGCGTAVAAAQKLGRRWIGIDITHLSIALQKYRLLSMFPDVKFEVIGEPRDTASARQLALEDRYQFQWWALSLIKAKPIGGSIGSTKGRKGSDLGIDGVIDFVAAKGKTQQILVQVKSGKVKSGDIRDLVGVIDREREKAAQGIFITLEMPTRDMILEATKAGHYHSDLWNRSYPRIQIVTIEELLSGKGLDIPMPYSMFKQSEQVKQSDKQQLELFDT